ncbi:hypothetical protein AVEN_226809-1 [Araneus ventricosus]|uniref:Apolipoprotein L3 n=1 Tax=Araneus ventricosus TaxID=182803 RepID=A0A4Y2RQP9_ARAVE|nr:hypothetical protein AVEN_226809-1 [Araneus ventricosus]
MNRAKLFERIFGSNRNDEEPIITDSELSLASFAYDVAYDEIHKGQKDPDDDDDSVLSFDIKMEAAMDNFKRVVELFKKSRKANQAFLKNFDHWSSFRKSNVQRLKEIAEKIQTDKFNSDIAKVVGGVVAAAGGVVAGLSFLTPLAPVTLPLAISGGVASALGGGVVVGTTGTEIALLKNKLEEAKTLAMQEEVNFSTMAQWFTHTKELKEALGSLLNYALVNEMSECVQKFLDGMINLKNLKVGDFKNQFKQVLKMCMGKMSKCSKIKDEFGDDVAPAVMTFIFVVCVMRDENRLVLDCVMITHHLALGLMSALDIGVHTSRMIVGLATKGTAAAGRTAPAAIARIAAMGTLVALGIVIDVLNVVLSSIAIHKRLQSKHAKIVKDAAEQLEKEFLFIESVYNELRKYKAISLTDVTEWTTIVVNHIPVQAGEEDLKMAVKLLLSEEAWGCIKLRRLPTSGNNWFVKVPASHSQMLLLQSELIIKGERCVVIH